MNEETKNPEELTGSPDPLLIAFRLEEHLGLRHCPDVVRQKVAQGAEWVAREIHRDRISRRGKGTTLTEREGIKYHGCARCLEKRILKGYNFCPICGTPVNWKEQ